MTQESPSPITVSLYPSATERANSQQTHTTESERPTDPQESEIVEHWTIDKKIPIAFLLGLAVQAGGIIWYFAQLAARQDALEQQIVSVDRDNDLLTTGLSAVIDRTTRLEVDYLSSKTDVSRRLGNIEEKLDRMLEAFPPRRMEFAPGAGESPPIRRAAE